MGKQKHALVGLEDFLEEVTCKLKQKRDTQISMTVLSLQKEGQTDRNRGARASRGRVELERNMGTGL
jgi:hypothetical protein